ncbi:hypothetical protein GUITHDRAFT_151509 [Guillardia theta CCMP2712]|uniref:DUF4281 domain-containing protein n=2 Tax=Guillardia theta TaxID=55529 RepID=L1JMP5_GUITC|nr:hypothetical protein GUITHDRAFT_151509 [Guillardia theta CCMP2712]EKX49333.1 hypothetical protein GUITHDRAFT_151509 [Guillardia theta CCMP2712]|eukprot:XP_005836313.1 hypothetical protein GUITHDRAFT_151509 [Guillardia theta CCMP2712]
MVAFAALLLPHEVEVLSIRPPPAGPVGLRHTSNPLRLLTPRPFHQKPRHPTRAGDDVRVRMVGAESLFVANNLAAVPLWSLMILFPKSRKAQSVMSSMAIFLPFIALYVFNLITSFTKPEISVAASSFSSLSGLAALFSHQAVVSSSWSHHICFDLFVGRWIFFDALRNRVPATLSLIATMLFGPIGLLLHLITRILLSKEGPKDALTDGVTDSLSDENLLRMVDDN